MTSLVLDRRELALIRCEIEALNAEFAYLIDHDQSERVPDLFTETGSYGRNTGERSTGRAALMEAYAQRAARGTRTARHVFTNLRLVPETVDRIRGTVLLILFAEDGPPPHPAEINLVSEYEDIYERGADGVWRYAARTVTRLFQHRDGKPLVLPLGAPVSS
jgi:hypothetical protein